MPQLSLLTNMNTLEKIDICLSSRQITLYDNQGNTKVVTGEAPSEFTNMYAFIMEQVDEGKLDPSMINYSLSHYEYK